PGLLGSSNLPTQAIPVGSVRALVGVRLLLFGGCCEPHLHPGGDWSRNAGSRAISGIVAVELKLHNLSNPARYSWDPLRSPDAQPLPLWPSGSLRRGSSPHR